MIDESSDFDEVSGMFAPKLSSDVLRLRKNEDVQLAERNLFETIARSTMNTLVVTSIEGRPIYFTGSEPFAQSHMEQWAEKLGAVAAPDRVDLSIADWFVLGRCGFDEDLIEFLVGTADVRFFSQEEFLSVLLFGEDATNRTRIHPESSPHPGLEWARLCDEDYQVNIKPGLREYLLSLKSDDSPGIVSPPEVPASLPEPVVHWEIRPEKDEAAGSNSYDELQVESELARIGYSVARGVSVEQRHEALIAGVAHMGLAPVINRLRWFIHSRRKNPVLQDAVTRWTDDLNWLESIYGIQ